MDKTAARVSNPTVYVDSLSPEEGAWLRDRLAAQWEGVPDGSEEWDCTDSHRLARTDLEEEMLAYQDLVSCCGKRDVELGPSPEGHTYAYGYNYGH